MTKTSSSDDHKAYLQSKQRRSRAAFGVVPWTMHCVDRGCRNVLFIHRDELAAKQPLDRGLGGAFGYPDRLCDLLIANLNRRFSAGVFSRKPKIDEEANRAMVVADQIAHECVDHIVIEDWHIYTDGYYSIEWHIAASFVHDYAPKSEE